MSLPSWYQQPPDTFLYSATTSLLLDQVCPALSGGQAGPRFFGLVTGGVTPSAVLADFLVTSYDPCVQVHLPEETISTAIEHQALLMLLELLSLSPTRFSSNTFTTGATASNLLGLTLGREYTVSKVKERNGFTAWSVSENGFGGIEVDVFCAGAHASVAKAASIAGIGRANTSEILSSNLEEPCAFDLEVLEKRLLENVGKRGSIVVSSFGEVNTGGFTPNSAELRKLCDQYDAWLHCDAGEFHAVFFHARGRHRLILISCDSAFGAFAGLHPDFAQVSEELALADSITLDAHKCELEKNGSFRAGVVNANSHVGEQGSMCRTTVEFSSLEILVSFEVSAALAKLLFLTCPPPPQPVVTIL